MKFQFHILLIKLLIDTWQFDIGIETGSLQRDDIHNNQSHPLVLVESGKKSLGEKVEKNLKKGWITIWWKVDIVIK